MSNPPNSSGFVIYALGLLGILFVVLKLTGYINWSWWYVTMPFWGGFTLFSSISLIAVWLMVSPDKKFQKFE